MTATSSSPASASFATTFQRSLTALTPALYLMIGLESLFDNQPAPGQGEEDLSLNTGVTIRF